jgi:hypothetical protein
VLALRTVAWQIRIDGKLVFSAPFKEFGSGTRAPFLFPMAGAGVFGSGYYSFVPMVFHSRLQITLSAEHADTEFLEGVMSRLQNCIDYDLRCELFQYWNVNLHKYNFVPSVPPFDGSLTDALAAVHSMLLSYGEGAPPVHITPDATIIDTETPFGSRKAGESITLWERRSGGVIQALFLDVRGWPLSRWNDLSLVVCWDRVEGCGESNGQPADIDSPIGYLFGAYFTHVSNELRSLMFGFSRSPRSTLPGATDMAGGYLFFPMPFARAASIRLRSAVGIADADVRPSVHLRLLVAAALPPHLWPDTGKLRVWLKQELPTARGTDFNYFEASGGWGHMVGHIFFADIKVAPTHSWVFEGDHRLWIDGMATPHFSTTGMEDLFNSAHMFRYTRNYSLPLHGAPYNAQSNKWGMEALAYRLHLGESLLYNEHATGLLEVGEAFGPPRTNHLLANLTSLCFHYSGETEGWILTDEVLIGDAVSELEHAYAAEEGSRRYSLTSSYSGHLLAADLADEGVDVQGMSEMTVTIDSGGSGVVLRRRIDFSRAHQVGPPPSLLPLIVV